MIRYAIWAAVSTKAQARPDKISLPDQEARCRAAAKAKGWQETAGPYIVAGASRTRYVNLSDAETDLPELRQLLDDAQHGRYDVLVMYDLNRLRDLLILVTAVLVSYRVQPYALLQPLEPQDPAAFDPNHADAIWMFLGMYDIINRNQQSDLRRKYALGMPGRVAKKGLPAISIPYGYRKPPGRETDRDAVPEQDPLKAPLVRQFAELLLKGRSLRQITTFADATGLPSPYGKAHWSPQTIRDILRNPFYAGFNRWGLSHNQTDLRTHQRLRNRKVALADVLTERGKHEPLWSEATHHALVRELDARGHAYRGKRATPLSRLLTCAACGGTLWLQHNGSRAEPERAIWRCHTCQAANIPNTAALAQVAAILQAAFRPQPDPRPADAPAPPPDPYAPRLAELLKRRERLVDIYVSGALSKEEYTARRRDLDNQVLAAEREIQAQQAEASAHAARLQIRASFAALVDYLPTWLSTNDSLETNRLLRLLLQSVQVQGATVAKVTFLD